ncbi:PREDICTED: L-Ala-D/L-amino acid epimerase isoform X2 [Nelumbo nucifera]|uniref:Dipeptide epimerase n=1 Tax=Nelumbo nucifera TaxID=4432 RepID=A0A1U8BCZ2_NELNU|nr:PREDICTED: L-Ala-D/L-amino acid epimerase isoform X2 [Nelumbo nucifera]
MDPIVLGLSSSTPLFSSSFPTFLTTRQSWPRSKIDIVAISGTGKSMTTSPVHTSTVTNFGFKTLMETVSVDVQRAEGRPLNVPLIAPFVIASSRLDKVENVAIRVELNNGCVGWGEAPILPFVTAEDQQTALVKAGEVCEFLRRSQPMTLGSVLAEIGGLLPGHEFASVRAGVEMALIDAVANSIGIPLWRLFGGVSNTITTDITIPIVSPSKASELASMYYKQGFNTLKLKVGNNLNADIEVLKAIRVAHPDCMFILDANEGYTANEAIQVLVKLCEMGVIPVLFEQPVHRDDWEGLGHVNHVAKGYGISVAADESCRSFLDIQKIIEGNLADVINIKLAKVGVMGALEIIEAAKKSGLNLMIGGMVETRLAMGFAGHLASGLGCFKFVDLDTPLLLSEDPVVGGYEVSGAVYKFNNARGHGGFLHWDTIAWLQLDSSFINISLVTLIQHVNCMYVQKSTF